LINADAVNPEHGRLHRFGEAVDRTKCRGHSWSDWEIPAIFCLTTDYAEFLGCELPFPCIRQCMVCWSRLEAMGRKFAGDSRLGDFMYSQEAYVIRWKTAVLKGCN
jgi:hypothetical protein